MKKQFIMSRDMLSTLGSTFYPTHHIMVMSDNEHTLSQLEQFLSHDFNNTYYVLTPQEVITQIGSTVLDNDEPLPSVGTEGAAARGYLQLAKEGHSAILIHIPKDEDKDQIISQLENLSDYHARHYRTLVIEDLTPHGANSIEAHRTSELDA